MRRESFVRAFVVGMAAGALVRFAAGANVGSHVAVARAAGGDAFAALAGLREWLVRVDVVHLPDRIETRAALTLTELDASPDALRATITDPAALARIARVIGALRPQRYPVTSQYDARWDLTCIDRDGKRIRMSFDAFGRRGAVDGVAVRFTGAPFVAKLASAMPNIAR